MINKNRTGKNLENLELPVSQIIFSLTITVIYFFIPIQNVWCKAKLNLFAS